jgi:Transposase DDE domain
MNLPPNIDPSTAYSDNDVTHWLTNDTRDKRRFIDNIFAELCVRLQPTRDVARAVAKTEAFEQSRRDRKRVEMLFAHLKRILRLGRLRLREPMGAQFEFTLAAIAQNLKRLAKPLAYEEKSVPSSG